MNKMEYLKQIDKLKQEYQSLQQEKEQLLNQAIKFSNEMLYLKEQVEDKSKVIDAYIIDAAEYREEIKKLRELLRQAECFIDIFETTYPDDVKPKAKDWLKQYAEVNKSSHGEG